MKKIFDLYYDRIITKLLKIHIDETGIVTSKTWVGNYILRLGVNDGHWEDIGDKKYKIKSNEN